MAQAYNKPCPCGSGFKYKHCCLRKQATTSISFIDNGYFIRINRNMVPKGMSKRHTQIMVNRLQMALTPYNFQSIGFLRSKRTNTQMFGILSIQKVMPSELPDVLFESHGVPISVNSPICHEMLEYYLPRVHTCIPNGGIRINGTYYDVYFLTLKQAYECLHMLNRNTRYIISDEVFKDIQAYQDAVIEKSLDVYELMDIYKEHMHNLFDHFKEAIRESEIKSLEATAVAENTLRCKAERLAEARQSRLDDALRRNSELERRVSELELTNEELREENRRLQEALYQASSVDGYKEVRIQIDREIRAKYPLFEPEALDSLIDGELIFRTLYEAETCYSAMVIGYAKGFEIQLRKAFRIRRPQAYKEGMTLGAVIIGIINEHVLPYCNFRADFVSINAWRKPAAHGKSEASDVLAVRKLLFEERLLEQLFA